MQVLGVTRSGKAVSDNIRLGLEDLFEFYDSFTHDDHYDAACIWVLNSELDHKYYYRNKEFHLASIGLTTLDTVHMVKEMAAHAKYLKEKQREHERL